MNAASSDPHDSPFPHRDLLGIAGLSPQEIIYLLDLAESYVEVNRAAVREMHRQVGDLELDGDGIAVRGLLVRHLILPQNIGGTDSILSFLAREVSANTCLNIMDQYHPCYRADENAPLDRTIAKHEYLQALAWADAEGLRRLA